MDGMYSSAPPMATATVVPVKAPEGSEYASAAAQSSSAGEGASFINRPSTALTEDQIQRLMEQGFTRGTFAQQHRRHERTCCGDHCVHSLCCLRFPIHPNVADHNLIFLVFCVCSHPLHLLTRPILILIPIPPLTLLCAAQCNISYFNLDVVK
mmetsp:Transcript_4399/g.12622  ORF Transcript_4399/g.12622 Transcript_4399/m.12622 type:complete len:153 (-) Transcript_4399:1438-1896(-)